MYFTFIENKNRDNAASSNRNDWETSGYEVSGIDIKQLNSGAKIVERVISETELNEIKTLIRQRVPDGYRVVGYALWKGDTSTGRTWIVDLTIHSWNEAFSRKPKYVFSAPVIFVDPVKTSDILNGVCASFTMKDSLLSILKRMDAL